MKKASLLFLAILLVGLLAMPLLRADSRADLQVIKKAVRDNPASAATGEVKWFKILVTDNRSGKEKVKVTVPIAVVELFLRCAEDKRFRIREGGCEMDLAAVLKELKAMGPMAFIEINEEEETVKVWIE